MSIKSKILITLRTIILQTADQSTHYSRMYFDLNLQINANYEFDFWILSSCNGK